MELPRLPHRGASPRTGAYHPGTGHLLLVVLGAAVGVPSALVAVLLRRGVHVLFSTLAPWRESAQALLLPALGAALGVWVVRYLFREAGGHGVPAVLDAVARRGGAMPRRSMFSRLLGSMFTVGSGGSAGLEGPIAFSAAAVGSTVGGWFRLAERPRCLLVGCGVAGGIGAIFNAPLTGLVFASEVVLAEWSLGAVVPVAVSATVATEIARQLLGSEGAFSHPGFAYDPADLAACAGLGGLAGLVSVALVAAIRRVEKSCRRLGGWPVAGNRLAVAALAGLGVGALGLAFPGAIGEGYDTVGAALNGQLGGGVFMLLGLLLAKFLATALTLGSGAPGGIFAPSLVLGAILGGLYGGVLDGLLPGELAAPGSFALVGMAGLVAGTMQAPLTGIFLVLETTNGWELVLPLILVAVVAVLVSHHFQRHSFYTRELAERGLLLRPGTDEHLAASLRVGELLDRDFMAIEAGQTLEDLVHLLPHTRRNHFAVVEPGSGRYLGMLDLAALRGVLFDEQIRRATPVETVMDPALPAVEEDASLREALQTFEESGAWVLPVVREGRFLGTVSKSTLFDRYRQELRVQAAERE